MFYLCMLLDSTTIGESIFSCKRYEIIFAQMTQCEVNRGETVRRLSDDLSDRSDQIADSNDVLSNRDRSAIYI